MDYSLTRRALAVGLGALLVLLLVLPACSDDPILGPNDGEESGDGGSYSSINQLSPPSATADSTAPTAASSLDFADANPERF